VGLTYDYYNLLFISSSFKSAVPINERMTEVHSNTAEMVSLDLIKIIPHIKRAKIIMTKERYFIALINL